MNKFVKTKLLNKDVYSISNGKFLNQLKEHFNEILYQVYNYCCKPGIFIESWRLNHLTSKAAITKLKSPNDKFYLIFFTRIDKKRVIVLYDIECKSYYLTSNICHIDRSWYDNTLIYGYCHETIFYILDCFMLKNEILVKNNDLMKRMYITNDNMCNTYTHKSSSDIFELQIVDYITNENEIFEKINLDVYLFLPMMINFGKVFVDGNDIAYYANQFLNISDDTIDEYDPDNPHAL